MKLTRDMDKDPLIIAHTSVNKPSVISSGFIFKDSDWWSTDYDVEIP